MTPEEKDKLIERYVLEELSKADALAFEAEMASDPDLRSEVELEKATQTAILLDGRAAMKARLQALSLEKDAPVRRFRPTWKMAIAASFTLFVLFSTFFYPKSKSSDQAYLDYYQPYALNTTQKGGNADSFADISARYNAGKYAEVIPELVELNASNEYFAVSKMLLGCAYLETQQTEKAISTFQGLVFQNDLRFIGPARFYLGLAMLKSGDLKSAKHEFSDLSELDIPKWSNKARDLLDDI